MGGKEKQSQRTKGNTKASSSARAAELLETLGGAQGFRTLGGDLGYVPITQSVDDADSSVDADFRMLMRKLTKRDTTTKIKALQEISVLCQEKEKNDVKTVLPFWPRLYNKLSIDHERRVREATQQTMKELVSRLGREIAPQLKSLMGPWLVSQCDPYVSAANMAKSAFTTVFSPAKQKDTLVFCKKEIMTYIEDNLLNQTAETLSDKKITEAEDMQNKYERTVACSLGAWKTFLLSVPTQHDLVETYNNILKQPAFWKLHNHQGDLIRCNFYGLLAAMCQVHPSLIREHYADKACTSTLYKIDESHPAVCSALWDCTLHVISTVEDWYKIINPKKGFLPKLWKILKSGGDGNTQVIYPSLLPLLSKIPSDLITGSDVTFVDQLFESIKISLGAEVVLQTQQTVDIIVTSFLECLRFCMKSNLTVNGESLCNVMIEKLKQIIESSLFEESPKLYQSPLYVEVRNLLVYLSKLSTESAEENEKSKSIQSITKNIWDILKQECLTHIENDDYQNRGYILERVQTLLIRLKEPTVEVNVMSDIQQESIPSSDDQETSSIDTELNPLAFDIIVLCYDKNLKQESEILIKTFCQLLKHFQNQKLFSEVIKKTKELSKEGENQQNIGEDFIDVVLLPLLNAVKSEETVHCMMDVIVSVIVKADKDDIHRYLETVLKHTESSPAQVYLFTTVLLDNASEEVVSWLKGETFGFTMVKMTGLMCEHMLNIWTEYDIEEEKKTDTSNIDTAIQLFSLVISPGPHNVPVLGSEYIQSIVNDLQLILPSPSMLEYNSIEDSSKRINFLCKLTSHLFPALKEQILSPSGETMVFTLFDLNTTDAFSKDTQRQMKEAWKIGAQCIVQHADCQTMSPFFSKAAQSVKVALMQDRKTDQGISLDKLNNLLDLAGILLTTLQNKDHREVILKELECPFEVLSPWKMALLINEHLLQPVQMRCSLASFPKIIPGITPKQDMKSVILLTTTKPASSCLTDLFPLYFNIKLSHLFPCSGNKLESTEADTYTPSISDCNICMGVALCDTILSSQSIQFSSSDRDIEAIYTFLLKELDNILKVDENQVNFIKHFVRQSLTHGELWSQGLKLLLKKYPGCISFNHLEEITGPFESVCDAVDQKKAYTGLVLLDILTANQLENFAEILVATLLTLPQEKEQASGFSMLLALLSKTMSLLSVCDKTDTTKDVMSDVSGLVTVIQQWEEKHEDLFTVHPIGFKYWGDNLHLRSVSKEPITKLVFNVMQFLSSVIAHGPCYLTAAHWDFILCKLVWWIQETKDSPSVFHVPICKLLNTTAECMERLLTADAEVRSMYPPEISTEWQEFFSPQAFKSVVPMLINMPEETKGKEFYTTALCKACLHSTKDHLLSMELPTKLIALKPMGYQENLESILNYLCPLMVRPHPAIQQTVYQLLHKLIEDINQQEESRKVSEDEESRQPPAALWEIVDTCREALLLWLQTADIQIGSKWSPRENSEELSTTVAYFHGWMLILDLFKAASSMVRACYAAYLRNTDAIDSLMYVLFCVMPSYPVDTQESGVSAVLSPSGKTVGKSLFEKPVSNQLKDIWCQKDVGHYACKLYFSVLEELPALVRQWWNKQDRRVADLVDKFTSKYVSPHLCEQQIMDVKQDVFATSNLKVKTRPVTREVIATYTVDEASIELVVTLPANHPLGAVKVEQGKKIGIGQTQWRNWMLQLTTFLQHQNGSIVKGLELWKRNVDKKFEGVEECYVCYSVIHGTTCQLPRLQCKTCKKKFHSSCLYKWFSTSQNSTCPLCRNLF